MLKDIWFVRHAESVTNAGGAWGAPATIPLTETGHVQAKLVAEALYNQPKPSLIVTSPYIRTFETAKPTLAKWPDVPHETWPVHEFTYLSPSRLGVTTVAMRMSDADTYWDREDPDYSDGSDAESFRDLMNRVDRLIERIHDLQHDKALIFSHGQFLKALFFRLERLDQSGLISMAELRQFSRDFAIHNTAIAHYSFYTDRTAKRHSLSVEHLSEDVE